MQAVEPHAPGEECRFAENNAPFIFTCLDRLCHQLPKASKFVYRHNETPPETILESRGIYMFYADFGIKGNYPVYIGKTEQGFKKRFAAHEKDGGVIWRYENNQFPTFQISGKPNLGAVLLSFQAVRISFKLTESMFLYPFDFALNKMENDYIRLEIKEIIPNKPWFSYETYLEKFLDEMESETTKLIKALRDPNPKAKAMKK